VGLSVIQQQHIPSLQTAVHPLCRARQVSPPMAL
jgi:hypothetical protein